MVCGIGENLIIPPLMMRELLLTNGPFSPYRNYALCNEWNMTFC